ncbi:unnamed protein product [Rhizoctonia solani]|uniref:Uncharacterized protein n=1 Tax=Rhizoctonia solani TaxID=456999 RepID=A0A8H3DX88_9AGAM|nr:unnamed protein product [Rhizoctonia solani]
MSSILEHFKPPPLASDPPARTKYWPAPPKGSSGGILQKAASVTSSQYSPVSRVSFAPLPDLTTRKRRNSITLGVAARSATLRAQRTGPRQAGPKRHGHEHSGPAPGRPRRRPGDYKDEQVVDLGEVAIDAGKKLWRAISTSRKASMARNANPKVLPKKMRKTHAQLCAEVWRKTHAQLVAEVSASRPHKSHAELEVEVFLNGLPEAKVAPEVEPATPTLSVTEAHSQEVKPTTKPAVEKLAPILTPAPGPKSAPVPAVAALRRQRSGTIMRSSPTELSPTLSIPQASGSELGRSRSMVEARTQMFERTHTRSQTAGSQVPPARTLIRQKSATFERAKSLFHTPEETNSEGSKTPPVRSVPMRRVTKLDMSKFGFA